MRCEILVSGVDLQMLTPNIDQFLIDDRPVVMDQAKGQRYIQVMIQLPSGEMAPVHIPMDVLVQAAATSIASTLPASATIATPLPETITHNVTVAQPVPCSPVVIAPQGVAPSTKEVSVVVLRSKAHYKVMTCYILIIL